jgi:FkbM family methyltransferase
MNFRVHLIRKLGVKIFDGNSTFTNNFAKVILELLRVKKGSKLYNILRRFYRRTGKVNKIENSRSSFGEDRVLCKYLPETLGTYIDIGAGAPINGSNTYMFYERGWHGFTIDPISSLVKMHQKKRPRDTQILAAVTDNDKKQIMFYEYLADDFSTTSLLNVDNLKKTGTESRRKYFVSTITLSSLNHACNPKSPTLLNIDVEGTELSVLEGNDWSICKPRVISVEEWVSPIYEPTKIRILLEENGYQLVSRCFLTSIYVHEEYLKMK